MLFLQALAEVGHRAATCAGSLRFVASILGHKGWIDHFADPVVKAWCSSKAGKLAKKEALPLPLHVVADLEASICYDLVSGVSADTLLVCGFLMMIWGSLRCSDAQRIDVAGLTLENGLLRRECWRTKSSSSGMPFGVLTMGICHNWSGAVAAVTEQMLGCDFMLCGRAGQPASFAYTPADFSRLLVQSSYTLHSMKATGLSWALQLITAAQAAEWKDLGLNCEAAPGSCGSLKSLAAAALGPAVFPDANNMAVQRRRRCVGLCTPCGTGWLV